jgi:hypothetical protein
MKTINLTVNNSGIGEQIFDAWYAYRQSLDSTDCQADVSFTINTKNVNNDINIFFDYMPENIDEDYIKSFDLVFFCNGGEPLSIATECMVDLINCDNVYMITNAHLTTDHPLYSKNLCFFHNIMTCRDYWTRHFYPQYFENLKNFKISRTDPIIAINGADRAHRNYFFKQLSGRSDIVILSNIATGINKLRNGHWESPEDTEFRIYVNNLQRNYVGNTTAKIKYYDQSRIIGVDGKFGKIPPGYFVMPEYFQNACVIFPETSWQNDELTITEKSLKCFYAGALPFTIGGSNINQLYNAIGFFTAWNLLPEELQKFDTIKNHTERYQMAVDAICWLETNQHVFDSDQCAQMIIQNKINFLTCQSDTASVLKLDNIIENFIKSK